MDFITTSSDLDSILKQIGTVIRCYKNDGTIHDFNALVDVKDFEFDDGHGDGINQPDMKTLTLTCNNHSATFLSVGDTVAFEHRDVGFVLGRFTITEIARSGDGTAMLLLEEA